MSILRRILPLLLVVTLLCSCVEMPNAAPDPTPVPTAQPTATPESTPAPTATPEPTMVPAMASATNNATKDAPDVKDPATWDDNAAETLASLVEQFGRWGLTLDAKADYPYLLAVNREAGVVTVYTVDAATGQYAAPYMAMVCRRERTRGWRWRRTHHRVLRHAGQLQLAAADGPELRPVRHPHLRRLPVPQRAVLQPAQGRRGVRRVQQVGHRRQPGLHPAGRGGREVDL